jgi:hypothetical protein
LLEYVGLQGDPQYGEKLITPLQAIKVNDKWEIVNAKNYTIDKIGGYGESYRHDYPI